MADVVNATHKERLSQRNSEPSHIAGKAPYTDIGGTGVNDEPNTAKVDGASGVGTDTTIPKSVPGEKSHLGRVTGSEVNEDDDVDVSYEGEDDADYDDLDKELDQFEDVEPVDVDVEVGDEDDDKKKMSEEFGDDDEDDKKDIEEDEERGENEAEVEKNAAEPEAAMNSGPNKVLPEEKEDGEDDDKKDDLTEEDDEEKKDEADAKEPSDAMDKKVEESVKIRIKLPNAKLFESAGVPAKSQKKIAVIFESAIKDVTKQVSTQMRAHYKKLHESKLAKRDAILTKQVDAYLGFVVEEWMKTNRVAVRQSLRSQLAEEFLNGLQRLFKEHYIDVPESKVDVVKKLSAQVSSLKKSLNEQTQQKMKLRKLAEAANKARIVAQFASKAKLSEEQTAKLEKLAEDVQYTSAKDYREKLTMLKESYFGADKKEASKLTEDVQQPEDKKTSTVVDPDVAFIADTLKRQREASKW